MRLVIAEKAEDDLARIYADLRHRYDLETADHFRMRAEKALKQLGQQPEMGPHPGWATSHQQLRFWVISRTNYIIYYEAQTDQVSIERVLDGRRDVHRVVELGIEESPDQLRLGHPPNREFSH